MYSGLRLWVSALLADVSAGFGVGEVLFYFLLFLHTSLIFVFLFFVLLENRIV